MTSGPTTDQALDPGTAFLMEAFDPVNRVDPYPLYRRMRESTPVLDAGNGLWFAFTHDAANSLLRSPTVSSDERRSNEFQKQVLTDPRFQRHQDAEPLMLFTDPPDHTRLRGLVVRAFTPRTVERLAPRIQALTDQLLDQVAGSGPVDLVEALAYPLPVAVICELLGVPTSDAPVFRALSDDLTLMVEPGVLRTDEQERAIERSTAALRAYISELLDVRRRTPGDDLISALLAARDGDDRLTEPELVNVVLLLLLAGHETTVNLIGNSLVALLRHPAELARWRGDPGLDKNAVDELLRYDSPVQMGMRVLLEPLELGSRTIPAFDQVACLLGSANRDDAVFTDPDRLDLGRPNADRNMSFGGGIHHCLGMALARLEGRIVLGSLVRRFPRLDLVEEPATRARFVLRGYERIVVDATDR